MMKNKYLLVLVSTLSIVGFSACGESPAESTETENESTCTGGKCDDFSETKVELLSDLEMQILDSDPDAGTQTVHLVGSIHEDLRELVPWCTYQSCGARNSEVHKLNVSIWASDGASDPEYKIEEEIELDETAEPGAGVIHPDAKYTTYEGPRYTDDGFIDVKGIEIDLLPWEQITIRVTGELYSDVFVDQTFVYNVTDCESDGPEMFMEGTDPDGEMTICSPQTMGPPKVDLLSDLEMQILDSDPDAGTQTVHFVGPIHDSLRELVPWCTYQSCGARNSDVHALDVTIWASDGASDPNYKIEGEIELDETAEPGAGEITPDAKYTTPEGFADDSFDSFGIVGMEIDLLPWQQITVQVTGELYSDNFVDQTFVYNAADCEDEGELTICQPLGSQ